MQVSDVADDKAVALGRLLVDRPRGGDVGLHCVVMIGQERDGVADRLTVGGECSILIHLEDGDGGERRRIDPGAETDRDADMVWPTRLAGRLLNGLGRIVLLFVHHGTEIDRVGVFSADLSSPPFLVRQYTVYASVPEGGELSDTTVVEAEVTRATSVLWSSGGKCVS